MGNTKLSPEELKAKNRKDAWSMRNIKRTGCVYCEFTNRGRRSQRLVRGSKPVGTYRWVAEIEVYGKRYRCRNKSESVVRAWLADMVAKYETF